MPSNADMNFDLPRALTDYLGRLDAFIDAEIRPLEAADDNIRFFDHRREWARTDFEHGGLPRPEWEALLRQAKQPRRQGRPPIASPCRRNTGAATARTCGWR